MLIGARTAAWSGGGELTNPYDFGDGSLKFMIDGEWNAGLGVHNETATTAANLGSGDYGKDGNTITLISKGNLGNTVVESKCFWFTPNQTYSAKGNGKIEISKPNTFDETDFTTIAIACDYSDGASNTFFPFNGILKRMLYHNSNGFFFNSANRTGVPYHSGSMVFILDGAKWHNGVEIASTAVGFAGGANQPTIGINEYAGYSSTGRIYSFRAYNRALTQAEVTAIWNADRERFFS